MKFFKFEEYSPACFELLPDSFVSRLPRCSDVSNTKILLSCQLSKILHPTPDNRRINSIIFESSKSYVQSFVYFNIPCTSFVIWKISALESHRSRMYFEWSDSSLCGDVRIQNDNFDTSYFSTRKRTESVFPFRDSAVIILDLNSGITYVHLVVPWDLIHLRTSLIVPDNFGIFVAYGFWKFDATRPAIASTRDFLSPIAPFFRDLLKLMETRNCYESTVYCSPERVLMKTFRYSILKME